MTNSNLNSNFTDNQFIAMQYSIKDLENLSSIKAHTIRIWEKRYSIIEPMRTKTNIRFYTDNDLKKIMNISILVKNGLKISKIAKLSNQEISEKAFIFLHDPNNIDAQIKNLSISMIELDERKFESILNKSIFNVGFENTVLTLIYPFLEYIGNLWLTGAINPGQEHFITNLIRQKMIVAIDNSEQTSNSHSKRFTLFLPENENHELGLLFYSYVLKSRGHEVLYLGQSTPVDSIIESEEIWPADFYLLSASTTFTNIEFYDYLTNLSSRLKEKSIIATGYLINEINKKLPQNISCYKNSELFINSFDQLISKKQHT